MLFKSKIAGVLFIIFLAIIIVNQALLNQVIAIYSNSQGNSPIDSISPNSNSQNQIQTSIIPGDQDDKRPYTWKGEEVTLKKYVATNGQQMVEMEKEISDASLTAEQKKRLTTFGNLSHPCCDAPISTKDCLHAVAAMGLSKFLIKEGWTDEQIKKELFLWYRFWWPKNYVVAATYLTQQGTDPDTVSLDDWLGPRLSSAKSFQLMSKELSTSQ